jgi:hypothetical protein
VQQGVQAGAPLPLHEPAKHDVHAAIDVEPLPLHEPATQELHVAIDVAAIILLHCPALHGVQADAPLPLQNPAKQVIHVAFKDAPIVALYVPAGQTIGFRESKGQ